MCGIHLAVWSSTCCSICQTLQGQQSPVNLQRRGPDACKEISFKVDVPFSSDNDSNTTTTVAQKNVALQASVLQMRRDLVEQPVMIKIDDGDQPSFYLCWNGEVYQSKDDEAAGSFETSDTHLVAKKLSKALETSEPVQAISNVLKDLYNAEYAFLLVSSEGDVYFGRDAWGRRSLLRLNCPTCSSFHIASTPSFLVPMDGTHDDSSLEITESMSWQEIPPGLVHQMSVRSPSTHVESVPVLLPMVPISPVPISDLPDPLPVPPNVTREMWKASMELEYHLSQAVCRRMDHVQPTAVLFSGGLDSAVVAALAAKHCTHTLHLYNVSFGPSHEKSADRQAALITHQTLRAQYPKKKIIFHDIVVSWEDIGSKEPHIRTILQPKTTLMDVNIATALWFASGGGETDQISTSSAATSSIERPRILLLGMGADELLGGYGRHRTAFDKGGWESLQKELDLDQARFWERNLGRDDRIVADHSREARFPFLDYHVTQFLQTLPLSSICDFTLPPGQGDKRILRLVATRLQIQHASGLVKRAIQFGSRISHLSDAKRFGSRRKAKGDATIQANK